MESEGSEEMPMDTLQSFSENYEKLKRKYEKAHSHIDHALILDDQRNTQEAIDNYIKGIRYMNGAFELWYDLCNRHPNESHSSSMGPKMNKMTVILTKAQTRVNELLGFGDNSANDDRAFGPDDPPPSYDATIAQQNRESCAGAEAGAMADAALLFLIEGGVQIYFIASDGSVSAPSYPCSLAVYQFLDSAVCQSTTDSPPAFLQVGDWIYPLLPTISPALHADWGAYIFPDVTAREPGCYVGVIIPDSLDPARRRRLEEILKTFTSFKEQAAGATEAGLAAPVTDTTGAIAQGIITASEWISWGLTKGAEKAGHLILAGAEKLRQHIEPQIEASRIDPRVQRGAQCARTVTGGAVKVSGFIVDKVGQATSVLARTAAPHLRRTSEALLPASWTSRSASDGRSTVDKISEVATSGLQGFSTVYLGLERSALILARSVANQTVQTVHHRYGGEAGKFTEDVVYSATNVAVAASSVNRLGPKAVAKQVAKETAAAAIKHQGPGNSKQPGCEKSLEANRQSKTDGSQAEPADMEDSEGQCNKGRLAPDSKKGHPPPS